MPVRSLRQLFAVVLAAIVAILLSVPLTAQNINTAELHGTVHDPSGAVEIPRSDRIRFSPKKR